MIERIRNSGSREQIQQPSHVIEMEGVGTLKVVEISKGEFEVVDYTISKENSGLFGDFHEYAFGDWDSSVVNMDTETDQFLVLGRSQHLRWNDVDLTPMMFRAPSFKRLKEALQHVQFSTYNSNDV